MAEIIEMPKLSDTMTTGTLVRWLKKEGEAVKSGDMIAEVETDKATMEVETFEDGVMLKHYAGEGASVAIGDPICAVGDKGEDAPEVKESAPEPKKSKKKAKSSEEPDHAKDDAAEESDDDAGDATTKDKDKEESDSVDSSGTERDEKQGESTRSGKAPQDDSDEDTRIKASPLARKIAAEKGVDLSRIKGSGPNGRIVRDDVLQAAEAPAAAGKAAAPQAPVASLEEKEIKVSNMRAAIARALVTSKTESPHFYLQMEVDGEPLSRLRESLNEKLSKLAPEQGGVKFTINDLILKAAAEAVRRVPAINRSWKGDHIVQHGNVHLAFGVAVDDGLVTPVIRDAEFKTLRQIGAEARDLIAKARNRKLKPEEMTGSTLTVTNLGMFGISDFYGIINPPNAAILSVGATVKTPVVDADDNIVVGYRMKIGLSGDHRVIDGAVGAQYLAAIREIVETPALMLV